MKLKLMLMFYNLKWTLEERWKKVARKLPRIATKRPYPRIEFCPECGGRIEIKACDTGDGWNIFWDCDNSCESIAEDEAYITDWFPFVFGWASSKDMRSVGIEVV